MTGTTEDQAIRIQRPEDEKDRHFFEHSQGNMKVKTKDSEWSKKSFFEAASKETVDMLFKYIVKYEESNIATNFQDEGFLLSLADAIPGIGEERTSFQYAAEESPRGGKMDQKTRLNENQIYLFKGKVHNRNEAGNIIWGATMNYLHYSLWFSLTAAQHFSVISNQRLDETYDQAAINKGWRYFESKGFSRR